MNDRNEALDDEVPPWWLSRPAIVLLLLALLGFVGYGVWRVNDVTQPPPPPPPPPTLAMIVSATGKLSAKDNRPVEVNTNVGHRLIHVVDGEADVVINGDIAVTFTGPVDFSVNTSRYLAVTGGSASFVAPVGVAGLNVFLPGYQVYDLAGSSFVVTDAVGGLEVVVTAGQVQVNDNGVPTYVAAGQTATWTGKGTPPTVVPTPTSP